MLKITGPGTGIVVTLILQRATSIDLNITLDVTRGGVVADLQRAVISHCRSAGKAAITSQLQKTTSLLGKATCATDRAAPQLSCTAVVDQGCTTGNTDATAIVRTRCPAQRASTINTQRAFVDRQITREKVGTGQ